FNNEYTYFSSYSSSWLKHARDYVDMMMNRFDFNEQSQVIEIASNDGYLLQYFLKYKIPVLGVDPASNTAFMAKEKGIDTIVDFFGTKVARESMAEKNILADLVIGNNVLAHVPDIKDFVKGMKLILKPTGIITMEFPHLKKLVDGNQFDTIYHEHYSYLSFTVVKSIFEAQGLEMFDVQEIPTHGGSLRIFARNKDDNSKEISPQVQDLLDMESQAGILTNAYYENFQEAVNGIKYSVWQFLLEQKIKGKKVVGYGAAAKGNTLLNYCGIKGNDLIAFVSDASPYKQNKFLPASRIKVKSPDAIKRYKPDYLIIFPWNLKTEISERLSYIRDWGGQFVSFIPELSIY
ncbi:MAG: class I SAM-dependent methyltransferase, partial [Bacteroidota bacterium]